jgi:hypothetical protein
MTTNYELRPGQGSAFKNKNKTEDWHPAYKGEVMLPDGTLHWIDIKPGKTKAGEHWFAIKIGAPKQPRQDQQQAQGMVLDSAPAKPFAAPAAPVTQAPRQIAKPAPAGFLDDLDDSIPF